MKPFSLSLPATLHQRVGVEVQGQWSGVGNTALLDETLLGLIASRECRGSLLLETLDRVPQWAKEGRVILSGFHPRWNS